MTKLWILFFLIISPLICSENKVLSEKLGKLDVHWLSAKEKQAPILFTWPDLTAIPTSLNSYRSYINGNTNKIPKGIIIAPTLSSGKLLLLNTCNW